MKGKQLLAVLGLAIAHQAVWWASAVITAGWVHNPEYWNLGLLVVVLSFPLGWTPGSWYPGNLEYLMMVLNSLAWGVALYLGLTAITRAKRKQASA